MFFKWKYGNKTASYSGDLPTLYAGDKLNSFPENLTLFEDFGSEDRIRKPQKKCDFHGALPFGYILSDKAKGVLLDFLESAGKLYPLTIEGRKGCFWYFWCTAFENCLDVEKSDLGTNYNAIPGKLGYIKTPVFTNTNPKTDIFRIPQDPNIIYYVTKRFIDVVLENRLKGFAFHRDNYDRNPILT